MRTWKDQFFKDLMETVLWKAGLVSTQHEIAAADAQWADVWFEPAPEGAGELLRLGWLGTICGAACIFESFSVAPAESEVRGCLRKLFTKQHRREQEAAKNAQALPPLPMLWLVSMSVGRAHRQAFGLRKSKHFSGGIFVASPGIGLGWIALGDLPLRRDTLLLRLMGVGTEVFREAVNEAMALPDDAIEKRMARECCALEHDWEQCGK